MILLHCKMASIYWQNSDLRALGIYIGVVEILKCGAIVQMENRGRIQPFLIQCTIQRYNHTMVWVLIHHRMVVSHLIFGVGVIYTWVVVWFLILEKWKVLLAIFKLLKISIFPCAWIQFTQLFRIGRKGIQNEPAWTNIDSYSLMHRKWKFIKIKIIQLGLFLIRWENSKWHSNYIINI